MLGVPTERYKIMMFVLSAVLAGAFGVIYAWSLGYVTTEITIAKTGRSMKKWANRIQIPWHGLPAHVLPL